LGADNSVERSSKHGNNTPASDNGFNYKAIVMSAIDYKDKNPQNRVLEVTLESQSYEEYKYVEIREYFTFDGTNDYFKRTYTNTANITLAGWFNIKDFNNNYMLMGFRQTDAENANAASNGIRILSTGKLEFRIVNSGISSYQDQSTDITLGWHHIAVTNGDGIVPKIYIDGVLKLTFAGTYADQAKFDYFQVGRKSTFVFTPAAFFNGEVKQIAIYDKILDATEIADIYNNGISLDANLQIWYKCLDLANVGNEILDSSGNDRTATAVDVGDDFWASGT
jgi:hypothetical protein